MKEEIVKEFFVSKIEKYGKHSPLTLGWGSRYSQEKRYEAIARFLPVDTPYTVLDIGCGLGDMYHFLEKRQNGNEWKYSGMDFVGEMVEATKQNTDAASVYLENIAGSLSGEYSFDYVVASGLFGFSNYEEMPISIANMDRIASKAIIFNCLKAGYEGNRLSDMDEFYADPFKVVQICMAIMPGADYTVKMNYLPNDFTVCITKAE